MNNRLKIIFMGTPDFAAESLNALISNKNKYEILTVVTQPDRPKGRGKKLTASPVKELALKHDLIVLQPDKIKDEHFIGLLANLKPDVIVVVAYGKILPKEILNLAPLGCINVHASLLPKYRGAAPIQRAIINGEEVSGITTMYMDVGLDTGDMILKTQLPISLDMTSEELHDELKIIGAKTLLNTLDLIKENKAIRKSQNDKEATYADKLSRDTEKIDWQNSSAFAIHNLVRGLYPRPSAYCFINGKQLKIKKTRIYCQKSFDTHKYSKGSIIELTTNGFLVNTHEGVLEILSVQPESKKEMNATDFCRGVDIKVGDILE